MLIDTMKMPKFSNIEPVAPFGSKAYHLAVIKWVLLKKITYLGTFITNIIPILQF